MKSEKRKLDSKITALSKQVADLESQMKSVEDECKQERNQKKYYEGLYKEEREKNIDLQKQIPVSLKI